MDRFPTAFGAILVLQTILDDLKLQLAYCTDDLASVEFVDKELGNTFIHELIDALLQLFGLHRIGVFDVFEHLGRERRKAFEV